MIVESHIASEKDVEDMLAFYKNHFAELHILRCEKCGSYLAIVAKAEQETLGLHPNELGLIIIPIGDNLLSSRVRLDVAETGERMMGFECGAIIPNPDYPAALAQWEADCDKVKDAHAKAIKSLKKGEIEPALQLPLFHTPEMIKCGNDSRLCAAEKGQVPVGSRVSHMTPFEKQKIMDNIAANKEYKPNFKHLGNKKHYDEFSLEKVI